MGQEQAIEWVIVAEVYNRDEAQLICGLLSMAGIPVKMEHEAAGSIYGLTIGPLAKTRILVPSDYADTAAKILAGDVGDFEDIDGDKV